MTSEPVERTVCELIEESHQTALDHGWWGQDGTGDRPILEQLMLMVTELAEAAEEYRSGRGLGEVYYDTNRAVNTPEGVALFKPEGFLAELADVYIRIGDTIGRYGLTAQFEQVLADKLKYNKYRPFRHGGKQA